LPLTKVGNDWMVQNTKPDYAGAHWEALVRELRQASFIDEV
jgi:hypothetical protein